MQAARASFTTTMRGDGAGVEPPVLVVVRDGVAVSTTPATGAETVVRFEATAPAAGIASYRLHVQRGTAFEAVSSPIVLAAPGTPVPERATAGAPPGPLRVRALLGRRWAATPRLFVRCRAGGRNLRLCRVRVRARSGRRVITVASGSTRLTPGTARVRLRGTKAGRALLRRRARVRVSVAATAVDGAGRTATVTRRATLRR